MEQEQREQQNNIYEHIKMGKRDIAMLQALRGNSRLTLTQISRKTKIPISTLFDKLKVHEKNTILKHTTIINFSKVGYDARVQFLIKTSSEQRDRLKAHLSSLDEVNTIFAITNGFDFLVEGIFPKINDVHEFKNNLQRNFSHIECHTHFVVEDVKREGFFAS